MTEVSRRWSPYSYSLNNPIRFIDPDGMNAGDYYKLNGEHLGSDGIDDNKAYVADGVTKNDKDDVIAAGNYKELKVTNSELLKLAAVTYAESSERVNSKEEKFAIASASMNYYEARGKKQSLSKVLSNISNATRDGNARYEDFNNSNPEDRNTNTGMKLSPLQQ